MGFAISFIPSKEGRSTYPSWTGNCTHEDRGGFLAKKREVATRLPLNLDMSQGCDEGCVTTV
jgi:hypothetical protein